MSEQRRTGAVISLEEVFRSREFGRRPARWDRSAVVTVEPIDPPQLEHVFLSEFFGHPEALAASAVLPVAAAAHAVAPRPTLVLLSARGDAVWDLTRYRGAIGAVSGVAAAALVVAGMSGVGTGSRSEPPTVSAEGPHPGQGSPSPAGSGSPFPAPNPSGATAGQPPAPAGGFSGGAPVANLTAATTPTPAVVVAVPAPAPVPVTSSPPPPAGGTPPPGPPPGGGSSVLTPVLVAAGNAVSTVGATVTTTSAHLAQALPAASPVTGLLGTVGTTVTNLGQSVAGA